MPIPAQFELGLELTNIVHPLSRALWSVGSLALSDAIEKAGSSVITEAKLASLIGKFRIDDVIAWHFREKVAIADRFMISRFIEDFALESGSGPTVQQALKEPTLFSMVIQLSALAFAHEEKSLANAIVDAIERIVKESGREMAIVPDYELLLGTRFTVSVQGTELRFGDGNANILIEESDAEHAGASLMDPADPNQPLFELENEENNPKISYEMRHEAFGFGLKVLQYAGIADVDIAGSVCWIIARSVSIHDQFLGSHSSEYETSDARISVKQVAWAQNFRRAKYPTLDCLLQAGQYLFGLDHIENEAIHAMINVPLIKGLGSKVNLPVIIAVLVSFARIHEDDLERCLHMPLSLSEYHRIRKTEHCIKFFEISSMEELFNAYKHDIDFDVINSFELLGRLILGDRYSEEYVQPAVLLSAWGWSVFFSSLDADDPADISVTTVRALCGVPTRSDRRKARIIDGPMEIHMSFTNGVTLIRNPQVVYFPGVSTAQADKTSVGQYADAFQFTRTFKWKSSGVSEKTHKLGFREMQELCTKANRLRPCPHEAHTPTSAAWIDERLGLVQGSTTTPANTSTKFSIKWPRLSSGKLDAQVAERVFSTNDPLRQHLFFFVTNNAAARWLQLDDLYNSTAAGEFWVFLRDPKTCLKCAIENADLSNFARTLVLL